MTVLNLSRVTVHAHLEDRTVAADLVLSNGIELSELLPAVVDVVGIDCARNTVSQRWTMSRLDGSTLDESKTLNESGVSDGDVLLLTVAGATHPTAAWDDLCHVVADKATSHRDGPLTRRTGAATCLWAAGFGAIALAWTGSATASSRAIVAAIVAVVATAGAIVACRVGPDPLPGLAMGVTGAVFAALAGFLAVPGGPAPPNFLLAAVVCSATSIVFFRLTSSGATCFTAIAAFAVTAAVAAAVVTIWPAPAATVGAMLGAASLAMLGAAAKLSIVLAGLSPSMPSATGEASVDMPADVCADRSERGHRMLTGLLTGLSASAALGTVLVAADQSDESALSGLCLTAVIAAVLLLRSCQQLGAVRSTVAYSAGMISATSAFTLAISSTPYRVQWVCLTAVVLGAAVLWLPLASPGTRFSPVMRRGVEVLEYLALGSVIPLACWVGDLFGIVRGLSLS